MVKKIRDKLYIKGFTSETIERALSDFDFEFDDQQEQEALEKNSQDKRKSIQKDIKVLI